MGCNGVRILYITVLSVLISACSLDAHIVDGSQLDLSSDSGFLKKYHRSSFVSQWKLNSNPYGSVAESPLIGLAENELQLPLAPGGIYDFVVKWGDGTENHITSWDDPAKRHTYAEGKLDQELFVAMGRDAQIASDGTHLFISDRDLHTVKKINIADQTVSTIAGRSGMFGEVDEYGASLFYHPEGIATDGNFIYIADTMNFVVRKINILTNEVVILAGLVGYFGPDVDGTVDVARFSSLSRLAVVGDSLFVLGQSLRKVNTTTGTVETVISSGLSSNSNLASDSNSIYISGDGSIKKYDITTHVVTTIAGMSGQYGFVNGSSSQARFSSWTGGIFKKDNFLYILDSGNQVLRKLDLLNQQVTTLAGQYNIEGNKDGNFSEALFNDPYFLTGSGNDLYLTDSAEKSIRKINLQTETVSTYAGTKTVTIEIRGQVSQLSMRGEYYSVEDDYLSTDYPFAEPYMLVDVLQWGTNQWKDMSFMFYKYGKNGFSAVDSPNTSQVVSMKGMFAGAVSFDQILKFDTRQVKDMSYMFADLSMNEVASMSYNQPINFDTRNVENMEQMFFGTYQFNQVLNFNTSKVTNMDSMFSYSSFAQDISNWNVSQVTSCLYFDANEVAHSGRPAFTQCSLGFNE